MSILQLCERLQDAWLSRAVSESTWGYPVVGALHVLFFALSAGPLVAPQALTGTRWIHRAGLTLTVASGMLLFAAGASHYYDSTSFRIKIGLLILLAANAAAARPRRRTRHHAFSLVLWTAVIFAARGIAFF